MALSASRRSRVLTAPPQAVWELIEDPHHMPRWWPGVTRMEGVEGDRWTQVFTTKRGKPVRADFHLLASEQPWRRMWEQEVVGTPFEWVIDESITEIALEPEGTGTKVTIEIRQKLRGYSRTGGFMAKRATRTKLDEALEGIARITD
jgi:uncharacterized protein YndB with AHSA1/START domain